MIIYPVNCMGEIRVCEYSKTIFLEKEHMKVYHKYKSNDYNIYNITLKDIKLQIRKSIEFRIENGYKVVFLHKKKRVLLLYNK